MGRRDPCVEDYIAKAAPFTEAKKEETRKQLLGATLQWLPEGKSRQWKYTRQ
jgi:hypothetical protein